MADEAARGTFIQGEGEGDADADEQITLGTSLENDYRSSERVVRALVDIAEDETDAALAEAWIHGDDKATTTFGTIEEKLPPADTSCEWEPQHGEAIYEEWMQLNERQRRYIRLLKLGDDEAFEQLTAGLQPTEAATEGRSRQAPGKRGPRGSACRASAVRGFGKQEFLLAGRTPALC